MKLKQYEKAFGLKALGVEVTPEMLAAINTYALMELTNEQVYVRKYLLAHTAIDRDRERFPEEIIEDFSRTLPGKSLLRVHDKRSLPIGLWFRTATKTMSPADFTALTAEEAKLPEGVEDVTVLFAWLYTLKMPANEELMANIDGGIYRHASIGFMAADLMPVKKDVNGPVLYFEYVPPGEATEGSIVWLGAQQGATSHKGAGTAHSEENPKEEDMDFQKYSKALGTVVTSEEELSSAIEEMQKAVREGEERIRELEPLEKEVAELRPVAEKVKGLDLDSLKTLAEEGKAFREDLVDRYASAKAKLGEVAETEEDREKMKGFARGFDVAFLKAEVRHLEARVAEKFPDTSQLKSGDPEKELDKSETGEKNPLVPDEGKEG
jgi:hypothetical protein